MFHMMTSASQFQKQRQVQHREMKKGQHYTAAVLLTVLLHHLPTPSLVVVVIHHA
jgi:hypothetical protein